MPAIALRDEPDYRVVYMREVDFDQKMKDVYIFRQTEKNAPFFDEILEELIEIEALLFADYMKANIHQYPIGQDELDVLINRITHYQDIDAMDIVLTHADRYFIELFQADVYRYLMEHQMSFFMRDSSQKTRKESIVKNASVVEVW